jgi:c-di-AMP phosphodiesterase-like protein
MINTKLINIYLLLFIIFVCVSMTSIVILSNNKDIIDNINYSLLILIVLFFIFILFKIIIYRNKDFINYKFDYKIPQLENNNYIKNYENVINFNNNLYNVNLNDFYKKIKEKKIDKNNLLTQFNDYTYNI